MPEKQDPGDADRVKEFKDVVLPSAARAEAIEDLAQAVSAQTNALIGLRTDLRSAFPTKLEFNDLRREIRTKRRRANMALGLSMFVLACLFSLFGYFVVKVTGIGNSNARNTTILVDCTTPHHKCYQQGQTQTAKAVQLLGIYDEAAVICARNPAISNDQIPTCISAEVVTLTKGRP